MRDNALVSDQLFGADGTSPDTYLCVLPLFHSFGQTVIQNGAAAFGGTAVMLPRFDPQAALGLLLKERVTFFAGVPTMFWACWAHSTRASTWPPSPGTSAVPNSSTLV